MRTTRTYLLAAVVLLLGGCATLPPRPSEIPEVFSMPPAQSGVLAEISTGFVEGHLPGQSGFLPLFSNREAYQLRLALIDEATQSIDAQYFIWQNDQAGLLLFDRLVKAADRGVRVRLLVDDFPFAGKDRNLAAISRHPNFEIKIFNPRNIRYSMLGLSRTLDLLINLKELNRRMHNKLFLADNRAAIVGGRNIGNPYFGLSKKYNFIDLDILVIGPVLQELSSAFDIYWNAELAYPGEALSAEETIEDLQRLRERADEYLKEQADVLGSYPLEPKDWDEVIRQLEAQLVPGEAHFMQDRPIHMKEGEYRLVDMLGVVAKPTRDKQTVVTPYLIPTDAVMESLRNLTGRGAKASIVTASLGANNQTIAHSHYKKYRRKLLETGAQLFEFRHDPSEEMRALADVPPVTAGFICLHVKAILGDRERCFVGSLNIDPRALVLNTENGLYIESPDLCGQLADRFDVLMRPENAWRVYVDEDNALRWEAGTETVSMQPARGFWQRVKDFFYRLLPVESQL